MRRAPAYTPRMPKTGHPMSVRMTNCGPLGWVTDERGYRYQPTTPRPASHGRRSPQSCSHAWRELADYPHPPEACLVNVYGPTARMGLHQDRDEQEFAAPVVSLSLGDTCLFRVGGEKRSDPTRTFRLASGDALVLGGEARLAFHGVDRIMPGTSTCCPPPRYALRRTGRPCEALWAKQGQTVAGSIDAAARDPAGVNRSVPGTSRRRIFGDPMRVRYAMISIRRCLLVGALTLAASAAYATDVVYPPGSRIGLVPPSGVVTSKNFFGYEDPANNVGIVLATLPVDAYAELERTITVDALKKQGVTLETRESLSLAGGKAFLVIGRQEVEKTRLRKWFLVAGTPTLTALVTVQVPEPAKAAYPDAADPHRAPQPHGTHDHSGRGAAQPVAVQGRRARRLRRGRHRPRARRHAERWDRAMPRARLRREAASSRTSSSRSRPAGRRRPASAKILRATCSRPSRT